MLEKFERYPLTFGPTPIEKLERLGAASRRRGRALRQARGLQFRPRLRRQQAAQARIHHPRRDRLQRRHAGLDRRRAVEPHAHGRRRRRQDRHEMPARAGKLGAARGRRLRSRRQHPAEPRSWAPMSQLVDEGFDIGIRESWEEAIEDVKAKGGKPYAIPAGASVHKYGGLGYVGFAEEVRAQEKELGFTFDYIVVCTVTGSTHAGMLVGFAKDGRAAQGDRHRRLLHAGADQGAGARDRPQHRRPRRTRPGDRRRRCRADRGLCLSGLRRSVGGDQGGDPPVRAPRRHDHRSRSTRANPCRA